MAVQTMRISNITHKQEVSLTIDNFSTAPSVLQSPPFFAYPGSSEKFCFEINFSKDISLLTVYLIKLSHRINNVNVSCLLTISTNSILFNSILLGNKETFLCNVQERSVLFIKNLSDVSWNEQSLSQYLRAKDILIVKATLTFSGYDEEYIISKNFSNKPPADCEDLVKDFRTMYESGFAWDVTFSIDDQTLHAHKAVICSRSPVFAKMFNLEMQEKNSNIVYIQDANVQVFNSFLLYLYTSTIGEEKLDTILALYSLANYYEVDSLRKECSRILGNNLTVDSICSVLVLADLHDDKDLKEAGKKFLQANVFQVVVTTQWAELISTKSQLVEEVMKFTK